MLSYSFNLILIIDREDESSDESDDGQEEIEEDDVMDVESEEEEEEAEQSNRPYMALLQSFQESSAPNAKRRKLDHSSKTQQEDEDEQEDSEEGGETQDADLVDEEEGEEEEEVLQAGENEDDSEDEEDSTDPFDLHFAHPDEAVTGKAVNAAKSDEWTTARKMMGPLRATVQSAGTDSTFSTQDMKNIKLKQKLQETSSKTMSGLNEAQKNIASLMFNYQDVLYCDRNVSNSDTLRRLMCSHALNHIFK